MKDPKPYKPRSYYHLPAEDPWPALTLVHQANKDGLDGKGDPYTCFLVEVPPPEGGHIHGTPIGYVYRLGPFKWKATTQKLAGLGTFRWRAEAARACYAQFFGNPGLPNRR